MSSHHIVREKQEPALLVLGMDTFSDELLGQLLEWSPTVIATQLMAEKLHSEGINVDFVLADDQQDIVQSDAEQLPLNGNSEVKTAMDFLANNQYPSVNIVADEVNMLDYQYYLDLINLVIFRGDEKIYPVHSGFSKWKPTGEQIKILSGVVDLQQTGLKEIGTNTYETTVDGMFCLVFNQPFIFISERL